MTIISKCKKNQKTTQNQNTFDIYEERLTPFSSHHGHDTEERVFQSIHEDQVFEDNHID